MAIKYKPTLFHDFNPNIRIQGYYRSFFFLIVPALVIIWMIYASLGLMLDSVLENITPKQEQWLWQQVRVPLKIAEQDYIIDKKLTLRVQRIFRKIPLEKLPYQYDYNVYVAKFQEPNAFALPGGNIIVTESLLNEVKDEDFLLFVLCHELGHFQNRDHLKQYGRALVLTKLIRWIFGDGIGALFARSSLLYRHDFSRKEEYAADKWGAYLLYQIKGNLTGAKKFLDWADDADDVPKWHAFFSTHPASKNRLARILKMEGKPIPKPEYF